MKKSTIVTILSLSTLILSACGAAGASSSSSNSAGSGFRSSSAFRNRPLTPEARLALGIIKLEGTPRAVDPAEAAKLLPLFQLLAQLLGASSTAPQELTAVMDQIQQVLTADQATAIGGMRLTSADMFSAFQQQAQASSRTAADPGGFPSGTNRAGNGGRGGGFFFGGGPGGGGFGGLVGGANRTGAGTNTTGSTAASAAQAAQQASNQISLIIVDQAIQLLQSRIKS